MARLAEVMDTPLQVPVAPAVAKSEVPPAERMSEALKRENPGVGLCLGRYDEESGAIQAVLAVGRQEAAASLRGQVEKTHGVALPPERVVVVPPETRALLQRLADLGFITIRPDAAKTLLDTGSDTPPPPPDHARRCKKAQKVLETAQRNMRMAEVLAGGGFADEAATMARQAIRQAAGTLFLFTPGAPLDQALEPLTDAMVAAIRQDEVRFVLEVEDNYAALLEQGTPYKITVHYDQSDTKSVSSFGILNQAIQEYSEKKVEQRLTAMNIDLQILQPVEIVPVNAADENASGNFMIMMMLPMLAAVLIAVGGIPAATDLVAGEKERGTFEPLLTTQAGRMSILLGKYLEAVAKGKTSETIKKLMGLQAKTARVIRNGIEEDIPIESVKAGDVIVRCSKEYERLTGRWHGGHFETYRPEGAEYFLFSMGSMGKEMEIAVDLLREQGIAAAGLRLRIFSPFPEEELAALLPTGAKLLVFDRNLVYGSAGGALLQLAKAALFNRRDSLQVIGISLGLGGEDLPASVLVAKAREMMEVCK